MVLLAHTINAMDLHAQKMHAIMVFSYTHCNKNALQEVGNEGVSWVLFASFIHTPNVNITLHLYTLYCTHIRMQTIYSYM